MYELRSDEDLTLYAMALQPTKRGSWCRADRKKSYKPGALALEGRAKWRRGDVSLLILRLGSLVCPYFIGFRWDFHVSAAIALAPSRRELCFGALAGAFWLPK